MAPSQRPAAAFFLRLLLALALGLPTAAWADPPPEIGLRLGARGLGEVWQDANMLQVYRTSRFTASGVISYRIWRFLGAGLEVGYARQGGLAVNRRTLEPGPDPVSFEMVPISVLAEAGYRLGNVDLFGALGCAITPYSEISPQPALSGTRFGAALQAGARIDTKLVLPSIRSGEGARLQAVELEIFVGRRQHHLFGVGTGLDLSAWRFGAGLLARF